MSLSDRQYDPVAFLATLRTILSARDDAHISRKLEIPAPIISKIRHRKLMIGPTVLLRIHEATGLPTKEIKQWWVAQ